MTRCLIAAATFVGWLVAIVLAAIAAMAAADLIVRTVRGRL